MFVFLGFVLCSCNKKESSDHGDTPQPSPSPQPELGKIEGRTEFGSDWDISKVKFTVPKTSYTNRIIVKLKEGADLSLPKMVDKAKGTERGSSALSKINREDLEDVVRNISKSDEVQKRFGVIKKKVSQLTTDEIDALVEELRKNESVEYASPEYIRTWMGLNPPNDEYFKEQWSLNENFLNITDDKWEEFFKTDKEIRVAVVDTGYRPHKDLDGGILKELGYDFISDSECSADGDGIDMDATDLGDTPGGASFYHGTFVAGIIAANKNNEIGIVGIAPSVKIIHVRDLGVGGAGTDFDIAQGIRYAAGLPNTSGILLGKEKSDPKRRADIINLSLGGPGEAPIIHEAIIDAVKEGITVVCAAGNEGVTSPTYPAAYDECISVGALNPTKEGEPYKRASYSNYRVNVDIMAPGGSDSPQDPIDEDGPYVPQGIKSTYWNSYIAGINCTSVDAHDEKCSGYSESSGTSFAAPHVSATVALMKSVNPSLNPTGIASILFRTAKNDNEEYPNTEEFGYGVLDALSAVSTAKTLAGMEEKIVVRLKNPVDFKNVKTVEITNSSDYKFVFDDVSPGSYVIHAGTDYDKDGIICEKGEKFGVYPEKDGAVFTVKEGEKMSDIKVVLKAKKSSADCPKEGG